LVLDRRAVRRNDDNDPTHVLKPARPPSKRRDAVVKRSQRKGGHVREPLR